MSFYLWFESEYTRLYQSDFDVVAKLKNEMIDYQKPRRIGEVMYGFDRLKAGYRLMDIERALATAFMMDQWQEYHALPPDSSIRGAAAVQMLRALHIDDEDFLRHVAMVYQNARD